MASRRSKSIVVSTPRVARPSGGAWRIDADVDGDEAWVAANAPLTANADVWASMMLMSAAKQGGTLRVESDLDARLEGNFGRLQELARDYWGFPGAEIAAAKRVDRAPAGGSAMFFTCGVDSFYTLRKHQRAIERLIFVRGLNINLVDPASSLVWDKAQDGVADVARELGIAAVFVETNLRQHPTFSRVGWDVSHVGALAGVAHALAPVVSRVLLGSSDIPAPYGSRPELDPLWTSGAVEIVNDGWEQLKPGKVRSIADWPLVHRHLRVCHEPGSRALNCGTCMKCIRTQLLFEICGTRDRLETFPDTPMIELIDGLPWVEREHHFLWKQLLPDIRDPKLLAAIDRLLARRPSAVENLRRRGLWMRRTASGRAVRRLAKRLLLE